VGLPIPKKGLKEAATETAEFREKLMSITNKLADLTVEVRGLAMELGALTTAMRGLVAALNNEEDID
jgi:hypothetical protein